MELCTSSFPFFFTHPLFLHIRTCWICCGCVQDLSGVYFCLFPALREEYDKGKMGGRMLASQCVVGNSGHGRKYVLQSTGIFTGVLRIGGSNLWWFWTWLHMDPDEIWPRVPLKLDQSHANMSISVDGKACSVLSRLFSSPLKGVCVDLASSRSDGGGGGSLEQDPSTAINGVIHVFHAGRWVIALSTALMNETERGGTPAEGARVREPHQDKTRYAGQRKREKASANEKRDEQVWYVKCVELRASSRVWPSNSLASNSLNPDVFTACLLVRSPRSSVAWVPRLWRLAWFAPLGCDG